jgi:hypothetical protein
MPVTARRRGAGLAALVAPAALVALALIPSAARAKWDPIKSAGRSLGDGAREALQPMIATTIEDTFTGAHKLVADVDQRLGARVDQVGALTTKVVAQVDGSLANRIGQIDHSLEKRILQLELSTKAVADVALDRIDQITERRLKQAGALGAGLVKQLGAETQAALSRADTILKDRTDDLGRLMTGAIERTDQALAARIEQIDEAAGRRLANVDVIATKQRLALEQTLVRVGILLGLVVFVVFVLRRLWVEYLALTPRPRERDRDRDKDKSGERRHGRSAWEVTTALGKPLLRQVLAAGVAVAVLFGLYHRLPLGAAREARELMVRHQLALGESLRTLEYTRVRFHASQLELLLPADGARWRAMAEKAELLRDLFSRPALLATPRGVATVVERVQAIERLLGDRPDPDVLTAKALVVWQVGERRDAEHEAASLAARALRLAPGGFALHPLAQGFIRAFLHAPWIPPGTPLSRDHAGLGELEAVLASAPPVSDSSPLYGAVELGRLTRELDRASSRAYVRMIEAHARVLAALGRSPVGAPAARGRRASAPAAAAVAAVDRTALAQAQEERTAQARAVVTAWEAFDRGLLEIPGLGASPVVLAIFRINDAVLTRALWFVDNAEATELAPLLADLRRPDQIPLKLKLAPARVGWARRYQAALDDRPRDVVELQEAQRWHRLERQARDFEQALLELRAAEGTGAEVSAVAGLRRQAALQAAALGLWIGGGRGEGPRTSLALTLAGTAAAAAEPALVEALNAQRLRLL